MNASIEELLGIETPCDIGAERAVLGAVLLDAEAIEFVREKLQGNEFHDPAHARIFRSMTALAEAEQPVDLITLTNRLIAGGELEDVGGVVYLANLADSVPTAANVGHYAAIVYEQFMKRQAIETSLEMLRQAAKADDPRAFIAGAEAAVAKLSDQAAPTNEFKPIRTVMQEVFEDAERRYAYREINRGITGTASGFPDLDFMTSGFQRADLIIVAARPSVGKTAFALNIGQNVAKKIDEAVAIFSLEMGAAQLVQRMICAEGNVDAGHMKTGYFQSEDWEKMTMAIGALYDTNIFIDDSPALTVTEIRAKCRRLKKERGLGMIIIDYLQLIAGRRRSSGNRQEEVSEISRTLKQIARELDVPVIALSQLSRGVEQRQDKRPMLSDLRESGAIEQDADIVAFLYRDDYYDKESEKKNIIEIIIAKQRNGPVGTVELAFLKNYNKFVPLNRTLHESQQIPSPSEDEYKKPDMYGGR